MKLNLDTVVSNLAALLFECQALKMENVVFILAGGGGSSPGRRAAAAAAGSSSGI